MIFDTSSDSIGKSGGGTHVCVGSARVWEMISPKVKPQLSLHANSCGRGRVEEESGRFGETRALCHVNCMIDSEARVNTSLTEPALSFSSSIQKRGAACSQTINSCHKSCLLIAAFGTGTYWVSSSPSCQNPFVIARGKSTQQRNSLIP